MRLLNKGFTPLERKHKAEVKFCFLTGPVRKGFSNGAGFTPLQRKINAGVKSSFVTGLTLTGVMITISVVTLLAVIVISQSLRSSMEINESTARATLRALSAALETYATEVGQGYPKDISVLITAEPPILNKDYIADSPIRGYNYTCESLGVSGYSCSAQPQHCDRTGSKKYTIITGGVFTEADCSNE